MYLLFLGINGKLLVCLHQGTIAMILCHLGNRSKGILILKIYTSGVFCFVFTFVCVGGVGVHAHVCVDCLMEMS